MKNNKKILVTGGSGFIGRNFINYLIKNTDNNIISLQKSIDLKRKFNSKRVQVVEHDLTSPISDKVAEKLLDVKSIVHLAGKSDIKNSFLNPEDYISNNILSITNLINHFKNIPLEKMIHFSTAEVFGPSLNNYRFSEQDLKTPKSPYALSKKQAEDVGDFYREQNNFPIITTYVMNVFGEGQCHDRYIPTLIKSINYDNSVDIHCDKKSTTALSRNYLHVDDVCSAIYFLLKNGLPGERYNIVSKEYTDNLRLAETISQVLKKKLKYKLVATSNNKQHALSLLNGQKLWDMGWSPRKTLFDSLKEYTINSINNKEDFK